MFKANERVKTGSTESVFVRYERKYGIDGALIIMSRGAVPHWVPLTSIKKMG